MYKYIHKQTLWNYCPPHRGVPRYKGPQHPVVTEGLRLEDQEEGPWYASQAQLIPVPTSLSFEIHSAASKSGPQKIPSKGESFCKASEELSDEPTAEAASIFFTF
ncbi:hypothetical protein LIER_03263 [Lithospermum erythrorhizon]|uniref:Uncharacterized protein n=1 Tax=Lithospermum erythrorhizon TaxID=34254 RepID=A0AAV3NSH9_LITER